MGGRCNVPSLLFGDRGNVPSLLVEPSELMEGESPFLRGKVFVGCVGKVCKPDNGRSWRSFSVMYVNLLRTSSHCLCLSPFIISDIVLVGVRESTFLLLTWKMKENQ